jgi:hypothetical protein
MIADVKIFDENDPNYRGPSCPVNDCHRLTKSVWYFNIDTWYNLSVRCNQWYCYDHGIVHIPTSKSAPETAEVAHKPGDATRAASNGCGHQDYSQCREVGCYGSDPNEP